MRAGSAISTASPSPLRGGARGGGIPERAWFPPSLALPHKGGGDRLGAGRKACIRALIAVVTFIALPLDATGQGKRERPAEEQPEHYPDGPNRETAFYFCTACHGFKLVAAQAMSRERWDESLTWMVERHKMPDLQGEERNKILDYLAAAFPERTQPGGWKNPFTGK